MGVGQSSEEIEQTFLPIVLCPKVCPSTQAELLDRYVFVIHTDHAHIVRLCGFKSD